MKVLRIPSVLSASADSPTTEVESIKIFGASTYKNNDYP